MASFSKAVWRDWSLVFFTVLTQASAGIVLCLGTISLLYPGYDPQFGNGPVFDKPLLSALVLIGVATLVSLLHLGNPKNAPRALGNLKSSWLSREILAIGIYTACLVLMIAWGWKDGPGGVFDTLLAAGCVAGIALLWAMARVYMIPTIPPWNSWYTPLGFTSTALSLGSLALLVMYALPGPATGFLLGLLSSMLLIKLVSAPIHQFRLSKTDTGIDRPAFDTGPYYRLYITRIVILLITALVMLVAVAPPGDGAATDLGAWVYLLLALVLAEEVLGRLLFYASYFRVGV